MLSFKLVSAAGLAAVLFVCSGCGGSQPKHPNQIDPFDGASYDSLTVAHAALISLRSAVSAGRPQYIGPFNDAAQSYATAYSAYALYRVARTDQPALTLAIANLTVSIVSLENALQSDLKPAPANVQRVHASAARLRAQLSNRITLSEILTELEMASAIASTIPVTEPYSSLAAIVIKMAQDALTAFAASAGQPIDLATIQPIGLIQ